MKSVNSVMVVVIGAAVATSLEGADTGSLLADPPPTPGETISAPPPSIWAGEVGEGFRPDVQTFSLEAAVALGVQAFGGQQVHDLSLLSLSYGHMLGGVMGGDHWVPGQFGTARGTVQRRAVLAHGCSFSGTHAALAL